LHSREGISLVEILVAITLLSLIVSPLFISLRGASKSNSDAEGVDIAAYYAIGKVEEVLAMDFTAIPLSAPPGTPIPSPISDTVTIQGRSTNRNVYVDLADGDGDGNPDATLKKITVIVNNVSLSTLRADYPYDTF
jgi:type II secretory pathway pseudopilin PulG